MSDKWRWDPYHKKMPSLIPLRINVIEARDPRPERADARRVPFGFGIRDPSPATDLAAGVDAVIGHTTTTDGGW